jgi:hypothetical protein
MQPAATLSPVLEADASWRVSRDGAPVALVAIRREGGDVVVATEITTDTTSAVDPARFASLEAADSFVSDLIASFSYLGCDVARA